MKRNKIALVPIIRFISNRFFPLAFWIRKIKGWHKLYTYVCNKEHARKITILVHFFKNTFLHFIQHWFCSLLLWICFAWVYFISLPFRFCWFFSSTTLRNKRKGVLPTGKERSYLLSQKWQQNVDFSRNIVTNFVMSHSRQLFLCKTLLCKTYWQAGHTSMHDSLVGKSHYNSMQDTLTFRSCRTQRQAVHTSTHDSLVGRSHYSSMQDTLGSS